MIVVPSTMILSVVNRAFYLTEIFFKPDKSFLLMVLKIKYFQNVHFRWYRDPRYTTENVLHHRYLLNIFITDEEKNTAHNLPLILSTVDILPLWQILTLRGPILV